MKSAGRRIIGLMNSGNGYGDGGHTHNRDYWTSERVSELIAYWFEGMDPREIANRRGVSKQAILSRANRSSLPPHSSNGVDLSAYPKGKLRKCQCCETEFFSEHWGLRMCSDCMRSEAGDPWLA